MGGGYPPVVLVVVFSGVVAACVAMVTCLCECGMCIALSTLQTGLYLSPATPGYKRFLVYTLT